MTTPREEPAPKLPVPEWAIVLLIAAVQFVNILDFVIVMPLGPTLARALTVPESRVGWIGTSYVASAALSGLLGAFVLERFDRRKALGFAMFGLVIGTAIGGLARSFETLLAARVIAGFFGGPATALSFSIIADVIPPSRRGKAIGRVMGAFSIASIIGVPAALRLATATNWRAPFFAVAGLGAAVTAGAVFMLPPLTLHLAARAAEKHHTSMGELLKRPLVLTSYAMTAVTMMGGFILIPNISGYLQGNLLVPETDIWKLYMVGGVASFIAMLVVGPLVDRFGSFRVGTFGTLSLIALIYTFFYDPFEHFPVWLLFVLFMTAMAFRNVSYNALTTKVPGPTERARFQSIQSTVQHGASALGATLSSLILVASPAFGPDGKQLFDLEGKAVGRLEHMPTVAFLSMAISAVLPFLLWRVESKVNARPPADVPGGQAAPSH